MHYLLPFFEWARDTWLGLYVRNHGLAFPIIETFHLLALAVFIGSLVILNLRLLGVIMENVPVRQLAKDLTPYTIGGLCVMLASGVLLFLSEAMRCYDSKPFHYKMLILLLALTFHFSFYRKVTRSEQLSRSPLRRPAAIVSLALWFGVGLAGRAIGFLS